MSLPCGKADFEEREGRVVRVQGKDIAIFFSHGKYYALDNLCPADGGASLGKGFLDGDGENVTCPWHGHSFNLKTGKSIFGDGEIKTYRIKSNNGELSIQLE